MHLGIDATGLDPELDCHHLVVNDWDKLEEPLNVCIASIPTQFDPALAPPGRQLYAVVLTVLAWAVTQYVCTQALGLFAWYAAKHSGGREGVAPDGVLTRFLHVLSLRPLFLSC